MLCLPIGKRFSYETSGRRRSADFLFNTIPAMACALGCDSAMEIMFLLRISLFAKCVGSCQTRGGSRGRNAETSNRMNEPPLNEFQFADEKEIKVRSRHSRAEKHFAWNVTSAQNSGSDVGETKMWCARKGKEKTERRQVH